MDCDRDTSQKSREQQAAEVSDLISLRAGVTALRPHLSSGIASHCGNLGTGWVPGPVLGTWEDPVPATLPSALWHAPSAGGNLPLPKDTTSPLAAPSNRGHAPPPSSSRR